MVLGESPAHSIGVYHRQTGHGRRYDRLHRVAAANLVGNEGRRLRSGVFFQCSQGVVGLDIPHFFNADGRSADTADANHLGIIRQLVG